MVFRGKIVCDGICGLCVPYVRYDIRKNRMPGLLFQSAGLGFFPQRQNLWGERQFCRLLGYELCVIFLLL